MPRKRNEYNPSIYLKERKYMAGFLGNDTVVMYEYKKKGIIGILENIKSQLDE